MVLQLIEHPIPISVLVALILVALATLCRRNALLVLILWLIQLLDWIWIPLPILVCFNVLQVNMTMQTQFASHVTILAKDVKQAKISATAALKIQQAPTFQCLKANAIQPAPSITSCKPHPQLVRNALKAARHVSHKVNVPRALLGLISMKDPVLPRAPRLPSPLYPMSSMSARNAKTIAIVVRVLSLLALLVYQATFSVKGSALILVLATTSRIRTTNVIVQASSSCHLSPWSLQLASSSQLQSAIA